MASDRKAKSKRTKLSGPNDEAAVLCTREEEWIDLAKRDEAQGSSGNHAEGRGFDMSIAAFKNHLKCHMPCTQSQKISEKTKTICMIPNL